MHVSLKDIHVKYPDYILIVTLLYPTLFIGPAGVLHDEIILMMHDIMYDMIYDIIGGMIGQYSIRSAAALRRPSCGSGLAATLPRLCRPGPALAEPLSPDPLCLGDRHHPGSAPALAPHPV